MEDKKLNRVFDRVKLSREREEAMLADLLKEKREVSSMKQNRKHRIPAAALAAAALAVVLAGTALASGYFGMVSVVPSRDSVTGGDESASSGYSVHGEYDRIPEKSLPEEVRTLIRESGIYSGEIARPFTSRAECEAFLGLKLAANPRLEELPPAAALDLSSLDPNWGDGKASNGVEIFFNRQEAATISVFSIYGEKNWQMKEEVLIRTDKFGELPGSNGDVWKSGLDGRDVAYEDYMTPNGLEAVITTETYSSGNVFYCAYFTSDNALYMLDYYIWGEGNETDPMSVLKDILDAYE